MEKEINQKTYSFNFLSGFILKIIAIIVMSLDHVGVFLLQFFDSTELINNLYYVFRSIGRIALPLFCFLLVEGFIHTHSIKKYALRLSCVAIVILIAQIIMEFGFKNRLYQGNIFIDLLLGLLMLYCLTNKKIWVKIMSIIPLLYGILSFILFAYEYYYDYQVIVWWLPYFLRPQYFMLSLLMILSFYGAYKLVDYYFILNEEKYGIDLSMMKNTNQYRIVVNVVSIFLLSVVCILFYLLNNIIPSDYVFIDNNLQTYSLIAGAFLLLYSGKRGYNAKWFEYGCYVYYPLHLFLLYEIFYLISIL